MTQSPQQDPAPEQRNLQASAKRGPAHSFAAQRATPPHPPSDECQLLLLYWSGELSKVDRRRVEKMMQSSESARQYLEELAELESAFESISAEPTERCLVSSAMQSVDRNRIERNSKTDTERQQGEKDATERTLQLTFPPRNRQTRMRTLAWASSVALAVLMMVSVLFWAGPNGFRLNWGGMADRIAPNDVSHSQSTSPRSTGPRSTLNSNPLQAITTLNQLHVSVTKAVQQRTPFRKRINIQVGSRLLAKIQSTRSKLKSFRRRMEKRS